MQVKKSHEELRNEVLKDDQRKDVNIYLAIIVASMAGISSGAGVLAVLSVGFLQNFRKDVEVYWMACIPFCFPCITGVAMAYRKQLATVGVHITLLLATGLTGGAAYGFSIDQVYLQKENCTIVNESRGDCHRDDLVYLYVIAGGIAAGFAALGLLFSFCACSNASKRRARRDYERELEMMQEMDRKNKEVKHLKQRPPPLPTTITQTAPSSQPTINAPHNGPVSTNNETSKMTNGGKANGSSPHDNTTTRL